jgi:hypothetical protein
MPNFSAVIAVALALLLGGSAHAQTPVQGFGLERFSPAPAGSGWLTLNDLSQQGPLGGAVAVTTGYAHNPLRVSDGVTRIAVVSDEAVVDFGASVTFQRFRLSLNIGMPLLIRGSSGALGDHTWAGPSLTLGSNPDTLTDVRIGADVRLLGEVGSAFRLGASAQLFVPSGNRIDYASDETYRAKFFALAAGDVSQFAYAAHLGFHLRPSAASPFGPQGHELLFAVAGGFKVVDGTLRLTFGPELTAALALRSWLAATSSAVEILGSARLEVPYQRAQSLQLKLGVGGGLSPHFGAPEWRIVLGVETKGTVQ